MLLDIRIHLQKESIEMEHYYASYSKLNLNSERSKYLICSM